MRVWHGEGVGGGGGGGWWDAVGLRWVVVGGEGGRGGLGVGWWVHGGHAWCIGGGVGAGFGAAIWGAGYSVARVARGWGWVRDTPAGPVTRA